MSTPKYIELVRIDKTQQHQNPYQSTTTLATNDNMSIVRVKTPLCVKITLAATLICLFIFFILSTLYVAARMGYVFHAKAVAYTCPDPSLHLIEDSCVGAFSDITSNSTSDDDVRLACLSRGAQKATAVQGKAFSSMLKDPVPAHSPICSKPAERSFLFWKRVKDGLWFL